MRSKVNYYFRRFGYAKPQLTQAPDPDLGISVVIPCFNEPDIKGCLRWLNECTRPNCAVEIIVVVNSPANALGEITAQNHRSLGECTDADRQFSNQRFKIHSIHASDLPPKTAGVGLARKIGMDEALYRFDRADRVKDGVIVCYDADCRCEPDYFTAIKRHFDTHPDTPGCSVRFEHPLSGSMQSEVYHAVALYELHLRYYIQGLRYAGFPHAYHTIGSSMAVRAPVYMQQGGMNKRKAGEDFYFLQKVIQLGQFSELQDTTVFPSPRPSTRVPFGTGKAVGSYLNSKTLETYPLQAFLDLREFIVNSQELYRCKAIEIERWHSRLPESLRSFVPPQELQDRIAETNDNVTTPDGFRMRFFRWLNAFRVMKFVHHARDRCYRTGEIVPETRALLNEMFECPTPKDTSDPSELLLRYRQLQVRGWTPPSP